MLCAVVEPSSAALVPGSFEGEKSGRVLCAKHEVAVSCARAGQAPPATALAVPMIRNRCGAAAMATACWNMSGGRVQQSFKVRFTLVGRVAREKNLVY